MSLSFWIRDYVFLPLATLRRGLWWRYTVLAFSMVLFGLWHRGTLLFLLWGLYHGVLLVLHRQLQSLQKRWNWTPSSAAWTALSWAITAASVSLGWIFFRTTSLPQAGQMLSAAISPVTYVNHSLSGSLYLLVASLGVGYFLILIVNHNLNHAAESSQSSFIALLARARWYWLPPLYVLVIIVLLILTHAQTADAAQFMYRQF